MKRLLSSLFVFLVAISVAYAQTKIIAHRSHSGDDGSLSFNTQDNFGIPSSIDVFVIDTATQVKKWVHVSYFDADSAQLAQYGLRRLELDTAHPRPDNSEIESIPKIQYRKEQWLLIDTSRNPHLFQSK